MHKNNEINTRMPEIWSAMSEIDFQDKRIIDLGCGHGDLVWRIHKAGARTVWGVDKELVMPEGPALSTKTIEEEFPVIFSQLDIDEQVEKDWTFLPKFSIATCMSVLPYLNNIRRTLSWMASTFNTSIIECQYSGDGPGLIYLKDDHDMKTLLRTNWEKVEILGYSLVKERNKHRTIWLCE